MAWAYYNEFDPFAAAWLRELITAGHIAPGFVDERSIEDVQPDDLREFAQVHFFAGIGVWSHALRSVGWPDHRRIWTGSCPCQPFSAAGKGGGFDDERHLWPAFFHLITQCGPSIVVGEQVASKDGLAWLDLVQTDMEAAGHAFGAVDLCAAGVGAPHIRQRLWWVGKRNGLDHDAGIGQQGRHLVQGSTPRNFDAGTGTIDGLDHDDDAGLEGQRGGHQTEGGRVGTIRPVAETGEPGGVADDLLQQRQDGQPGKCVGDEPGRRVEDPAAVAGFCDDLRPRPTNSHWRDADWLFCRDGKWRAVEPGTFPLAHGASARVGRLRGYGNAIVSQAAQAFLDAVQDTYFPALDLDAT